uniref:Photosystem I assembly protein Ycf3 n=1 Tax=Candidatus Methanophagaceae archaeon ANME-1 ERB6 TaxID=2759912 RepID=A0A7G9YZW7_9EURY|nr:photosystem I assembly protein Ycf3 [Methanosarcinales archaeon ANME-1 ERB6]
MPDFVGREKELNDFDNFLTAKEEGVFVVIGEIGIGKTLLMKELSNRVKPKEDVIIGFYKLPGVVATHTPFVEVLADLLSRIEERDKSEGTTTFKHIGDAIEEVLKRRKSGFVTALLKDVSKDLKLDATLKFLGRIWKETKTVSAIELAEETIAQHKQEFTDFYLDLLGALVQRTNKKIVLMIDQFERATKSSIDFFLSVVRGLPKGVYMIASFKIGAEARHYEEHETKLIYEGCKIAELKGLSEAEIGEWIRRERGVEFLKPELRKIRRESGGFPVLLNEWISQSEELNSDELKGERKKSLFNFYEKRLDKVDDNTQVFARKLSVLLQPLTLEGYTRLVKEDEFTKEECDNCIRRLIQAQIFSEDEERWFKHELMQEYVRDENMGDELRKSYHENAAMFFEEPYKNTIEKREKVSFAIALGYAYHFHHAGLHEKSYSYNSSLADFSFETGSLDVAEECYLRAIEDAKELRDEEGIAIQRGNLARVYYVWGRLDDALNTYKELYKYFREKGGGKNEAVALHQIGNIHYLKGEYEKALENYNKSLEIEEEIGNTRGIALAQTLHQIGMIHQDKGEYEKALENYNKSLEIEEEIGNKSSIAKTLLQIGNIHYLKGEYEKALEKYNKSLEIGEEIGNKSGIAQSLHGVGRIHQAKEEYEKALEKYNKSLEIEEEIGNKSGIAQSLHGVGMIHQAKGEYEKALEKYNKSLEIKEELGDKQGIALTLGQIGRIKHGQKKYHEAILALTNAMSLFKELESPYFELAMKDLASIKEEIGEDKFKEIMQELEK